ncbi:MAG: S-layer homology domain-containing protein [Ruminococcaceae bacterium]|nr:S-layer homology domain-containing protein [Oscillospiraceae bacterium]
MKRLLVIMGTLLVLFLLTMIGVSAQENDVSAFELPKPTAPNYFKFTDGDASAGQHDDLRMIMIADEEVALLAAEYYSDSDAFLKKYGLYSFNIVMQYDISLDGEDNWQYTGEWDSNAWIGGYGNGYQSVSIGSEMMDDFEFFWLVYYEGPGSESFAPMQDAIYSEKHIEYDYEQDIYSFDVKNHSLYIRCRYYMEWETYDGENLGEMQRKFSDWSESAIFGKGSTQIIPEAPTTYEAPIISDLKIIPPEEEASATDISYIQTTPESVWMTNIYYIMTGEGYFDGLETQISINGGDWQDYNTVDSWGDWCLYNGERIAFSDDVWVYEDTHLKLRIRFLGTNGPSPWSNVLEINAGDPLKGFADVNSGAWYAEGIRYCIDQGYMSGTSATTFNPNGKLTREQFVTVLARVAGAELDAYRNKESVFTDVKVKSSTEWYYPAIAWANEKGYVNGIGNGRFGVGQDITREQIATMFFRYAEKQGKNTEVRADLSQYTDVGSISAWAKDACAWAVNAGLLGSTNTNYLILSPKMTVTRAQAAKIFMSYDIIK